MFNNVIFIFLSMIFSLDTLAIVTTNSNDKPVCENGIFRRLLKGGKVTKLSNGHGLELTYLKKSFFLSRQSILRHISHDKNIYSNFFPEEHLSELIIIGGKSAAIIYYHLLEYYKKNPYQSCQILDFEGGIVYAEGITCRWGKVLNFGEEFSCTFIAYDSGETSSSFIALPKPRVSSGNASVLQESLAQAILEYGFFEDLNNSTIVTPLNSNL